MEVQEGLLERAMSSGRVWDGPRQRRGVTTTGTIARSGPPDRNCAFRELLEGGGKGEAIPARLRAHDVTIGSEGREELSRVLFNAQARSSAFNHHWWAPGVWSP